MLRFRIALAALCFGSGLLLAQQQSAPQPKGVPARSTADDYTAHISVDGVTYAASLLSADQVKHAFAFDISKNYVVFEVAVYPQVPSSFNLDPDGFVVRSSSGSEPVHASDSVTVASEIQQKNLPSPPSNKPAVTASTAVGYESGTDPYTGQRYHGTYTATEVGVDNRNNFPPAPPSPGGYPQDRALLENQLWDRSLPQAKVDRPTAGYLYFPVSLVKRKSGGQYVLQYLGSDREPVLSGNTSPQKIELVIPTKAK